jgi:3-oxoacyl-[acyl-carrier-protein] synthase III
MTTTISLLGLGYHLPENILTNADLEWIVDTSDEWITSRTGISERRIVGPGETCSEMALSAARKALTMAGVEPMELTHIIVGTFTADSYIPSCACILQNKLGNRSAVCLDVSAACSGFLYSMETARAMITLHPKAKVLVVGSEVVSSRLNFRDRSTCVLFGDGAGAAVVAATDPAVRPLAAIDDIVLHADGSHHGLLTVTGGGSAAPPKLGERIDEGYFVQMQGREVFKNAVRSMEAVTREILERNGLKTGDVDVFIPHQANIRIIDAMAKRLEFPLEKIYVNLHKYGNTSAASIPVALAEAWELGFVAPGSTVVLSSFGGGFTWASALLRFS